MNKQSVARCVLDEAYLEPVVRRTLARDEAARARVWLALTPWIEKIAGYWRVTSRLSKSKDERRNVVLRVLDRLEADGFRRLGVFHGFLLRQDGSARAWLSVVTRRVAISHARRHPEYLGAGAARRWADVLPFTDEVEEALPVSLRLAAAIDAHRVFACAERDLEPSQVEALRSWIQGDDHEQIASKLGLAGAAAAEVLVRGAIMYLRRLFGCADGGPGGRRTKAR